ncbi:restriction endonuclease (plasmid) [Bacillus mycoides]|uniref:restriction endonuclease n=1 Tax=Bacillus mycoides TaxID=1405 RepID=UPI003CF2D2F8
MSLIYFLFSIYIFIAHNFFLVMAIAILLIWWLTWRLTWRKRKKQEEINRINRERIEEEYRIYMHQLSMSDINEIDRMDGHQFEAYLGALFERLGYQTEVTKASGDFGADLVLYAENRKIVVQAKRYINTVGVSSVQEVAGAKNYYNAHEAWVVTNSSFSKPAYQLAKANDVLLLDRMELIRLSAQANEEYDPNFRMERMK